MTGTDLLKKTKPICISEKLGLYLKNPRDNNSFKYVKSLVKQNYHSIMNNHKNYKRECMAYLADNYYDFKKKYNISIITTNQMFNLITRNINVLEIIPSDTTLIANDEDYFLTDENDDYYTSPDKALINPIDEYEIEYKILFLFNLLQTKSFLNNDITVSFYTGYPVWDENNIFDSLWKKTYRERRKKYFGFYKYYPTSNDEYSNKVYKLKEFGKKLDNFLEEIDDFFRLDFIIETLMSANNTPHSIPSYTLLIEMLIINPRERIREQYKKKIKFFVNKGDFSSENQIVDFSKRLYDIRSRLVHGNYNSLKKELKDFDKIYNANSEYDFGEFKEENWILQNVSYRLKNIVINILEKMLNDKKWLNDFKFDLITDEDN